MSEQIQNQNQLPTKTIRKNIIVVTLLYCWSLITWLIINGEPTNSLHTSALTWAFSISLTVTMAYVFGVIIDNFNILKSGKNIQLHE